MKLNLLSTVVLFSLMLFTGSLAAQRTVSGTVTGDGEPLPGVSVLVKNSSTGTVTDVDGSYSLRVPGDNSVLLFSYVGFESQEISVDGRSQIDVVMGVDSEVLDEVVVIGYGTAKKSDVTGAITTVDTKDFGDVTVSDARQLLQGKAPGVQVVNNNGLPGSGARIVIRGTGSFTNTEPLYVIDGIQAGANEFNSISPFEIESITVLKDAASVAIYGARGANGVVIVSTKKGSSGAARVTYDGYVGVSRPWQQLDLLNADQYIDLVEDIAEAQGTDLPPKLMTSDVRVTRTDWQDVVFQTGLMTEHNIGVSGGTERFTYKVAGGYTNQEGIMRPFRYQRANLRASLNQNLGEKVRLGQNINLRYQQRDGSTPSFIDALRMPPYLPQTDPDNLGGFSRGTSIDDLNDAFNPLANIFLEEDRDRDVLTYLQVYGEVDFLRYFTWRTQASVSLRNDYDFYYQFPYANGNLVFDRLARENYSFGISPLVENILSFNQDLGGGIHRISALVGNTFQTASIGGNAQLNASGYPNDAAQSIRTASSITYAGGGFGISAQRSFFGRLSYTLLDRYTITGSFRRDGIAPQFGPNNRYGNFPSVGVSWNLGQEDFLVESSLSGLKLRASWGQVGNASIPGFLWQSNVWRGRSANNTIYALGTGEVEQLGSTIAVLPNPDLRWEETTQWNVGFDIAFLDNRLTAAFDYYNRDNDGLLVSVPIPLSTGFGQPGDATGSILQNAANAINKGFEFQIGWRNGAGTDFSYEFSANAGYNNNEVVFLGTDDATPIVSGGFDGVSSITRTDVGQPIGAFYGYRTLGVAVDQAQVDALNAGAPLDDDGNPQEYQTDLLPGDIIFQDLNGDGIITEEDQTFLGSPIPDWNYGINFNMGWKQIDFMFSFQGVAGVELVNALTYWMEGTTRPFNSSADLLNRWRQPGDVTDIPRAGQNANGNLNLRPSDRYVEDGSFLRLRNLTVGYTLPTGSISSRISRLRFYLTAQNLLTFTDYSGYDPEVSANGNFIFQRGIDRGQYPQPRTFLLGVQLGL